MPATEAQKRAAKKFRESHKEYYRMKSREQYHRDRAKLAALKQRIADFSEACEIKPMDCSKIPGAPEL